MILKLSLLIQDRYYLTDFNLVRYISFSICFRPHYSVNMTGVRVGHTFLSIPTDASEAGDRRGTIIDSGTTLAYLPEWIYEPLVYKVYK